MKVIAIILFLIFSNVCYCQQDTVKVVMLYSDTALTDLYGVDDEGNEYTEIGFDENSYWRFGYVVRQFIKDGWDGDRQIFAHWADMYLLDADKVRIPKTNVVWFYKTVK